MMNRVSLNQQIYSSKEAICLSGKNWLKYVGKRMTVTGSVDKKKGSLA